jgi:endonuclease/exonuclease/phosphatase family metal-dependent hydrolase
MFYNVENLFDCHHDTLKQDFEYLPEGLKHWNQSRLKKKIYHLNKVVVAVGKWEPPTLIGLSEIENEEVLRKWIKYSPLKSLGYEYIMTDSPDLRGIDVALLWQRHLFRYLRHESIRVSMQTVHHRPTRDLLHVEGLVLSGDTLDVYVCHFPSRYGGKKESEAARKQVAIELHRHINQIIKKRLHPLVLVMGDFNDTPKDTTLKNVLKAQPLRKNIVPDALYNLMYAQVGIIGSHCYHGEWALLDQIIVSGTLLNPKYSPHIVKNEAHIVQFPFLLKDDEKYGGRMPFRTYYGMRYWGGYSDHLPVWCDLEFIRDDKVIH